MSCHIQVCHAFAWNTKVVEVCIVHIALDVCAILSVCHKWSHLSQKRNFIDLYCVEYSTKCNQLNENREWYQVMLDKERNDKMTYGEFASVVRESRAAHMAVRMGGTSDVLRRVSKVVLHAQRNLAHIFHTEDTHDRGILDYIQVQFWPSLHHATHYDTRDVPQCCPCRTTIFYGLCEI